MSWSVKVEIICFLEGAVSGGEPGRFLHSVILDRTLEIPGLELMVVEFLLA